MQETAEILGQTIRATRRARGLSLERLAELSGLSLTYTGEIEIGKKDPSLKSLVKIARALRTPLGVLLGPLDFQQDKISKMELLEMLGPHLKETYNPEEVSVLIARLLG